ncbi:ester cyclase [Candidatus Eisenbacteria bacterium]|uniref:Ester cyclase n=1 Tax=Eiseniibacteriota bacterium TaxID=2212470 RepID=A0ABV6YNP4_UNCEI
MYQRVIFILMIVATLVVACGPSPSDQLQANKELVQRFTESLNATDWDALDELLTEDFSRHSQATPGVQVTSREEFKQLQESFLVSMPDQRVTLEMLIAEADMVAAYATYSGTHTGPMGEFPPTGKSVESKFLCIFRIDDDRIAELWVEADNMAMLTQLGLFPPPVAPND